MDHRSALQFDAGDRPVLRHEAERISHGAARHGDIRIELVTGTSRQWTEGIFQPHMDTLTYLCSGPAYGFRNGFGPGEERLVAQRADWMRFVPAGEVITSARPPGSWTYLLIFLPPGVARARRIVLDADGTAIAAPMRQLAACVASQAAVAPDGGALAALNKTLAHLDLIEEAGGQTEVGATLTMWRLKRVLKLIEDDLGEELTLARLAREVGLSQPHFCTTFGRIMGITPHQYVVSRRLEIGRTLVTTTDRSLTDIALEVGFSSTSHFSVAFSKYFGHAPKKLRAQPSDLASDRRTLPFGHKVRRPVYGRHP